MCVLVISEICEWENQKVKLIFIVEMVFLEWALQWPRDSPYEYWVPHKWNQLAPNANHLINIRYI